MRLLAIGLRNFHPSLFANSLTVSSLSDLSALSDHNDSLPFGIVNVEAHFIKVHLCCRAFKAGRDAFSKHQTTIAMNVVQAVTGCSASARALEEHDFSEDEMAVINSTEKWARISRESSETLMVTTLALGRQSFVAPALPGETVLPLLSYAPEQMACMVLFAPTLTIKIQLLALAIFHCGSTWGDMSRSLIERVKDMFKAAAPQTASLGRLPSTSPATAKSIIGRCGEILLTLLKLWDARTHEAKVREDNIKQPSGAPPVANTKDSYSLIGSEEELAKQKRRYGSETTRKMSTVNSYAEGPHRGDMDTSASTSSSLHSASAQYSQQSSSHHLSQPEIYSPRTQQYLSSGSLPDLSNAYATDLSNLDFTSEISFDFDMSQFLDPTLTFGVDQYGQLLPPYS